MNKILFELPKKGQGSMHSLEGAHKEKKYLRNMKHITT